jgi:hypothetical protein
MALREESLAQPNSVVDDLLSDSGGLQFSDTQISLPKEEYLFQLLSSLPPTLRQQQDDKTHAAAPNGNSSKSSYLRGYAPTEVLRDAAIQLAPSNYFDPIYEAEYLDTLDPQLEDTSVFDDIGSHMLRVPPSRILPADRDLASQNQDSVVSWLRRNHPESFMHQADKTKDDAKDHKEHAKDHAKDHATTTKDTHHHSEAENGPGGPKDAISRSGNKRPSGGGKRLTIKKEQEEMYDDEGFPIELPEKPKKGRARADDQSYRPKGGGTKGKRKRETVGGGGGGGGGDGNGNRGKRVKSTAGSGAPGE